MSRKGKNMVLKSLKKTTIPSSAMVAEEELE